ncbi:MAG: hypothetical protein ACYDAL_15080 [Candidatus Dormibacteraceae bacterium]
MITLASACGGASSQGSRPTESASDPSLTVSAPPATSAPIQASPSPTAAAAQVRCEDLPDQTYTSDTFRFTVACPSNFTWFIVHSAGRLFSARVVDDRYLSGYPSGEVDIATVASSGNTLNDWVAAHTGKPNTADANHFWDSTSNLTSIQIDGRPAIGFDYVLVGPGDPPAFHAEAFLLPEGSVFLIDWWADSSEYATVIAGLALQMIASIQVFGA